MSRWHGPYYRGARRDDRRRRKIEAETRDTWTPWRRRREAREGPVEYRRGTA